MEQLKKIQSLVFGMGESLLCYGAEISRVEETMQRVADHFQIEELEMYVITNGLFVNMYQDGYHAHTKLQYVSSVSINLKKLCDINELSRNIEAENLPVETALKRLDAIRRDKNEPAWKMILASGIGSAAFCYLFGGNMRDCLGALICGILLQMLFTVVEMKQFKMSKVLMNIVGGLFVTIICLLLIRTHVAEHLDQTIMGAIIPLIPGVAFTNGIRDIADGDYLSGCIRLLDAILIFCSIAIGVGIGLRL